MFIESRQPIAGCGKNIVAAAELTVDPRDEPRFSLLDFALLRRS